MSNVLLMSGKVLVDRLTDAGASTGYLDPAEVGTLQIEETTELKTLKSKGRDTYGQVIASVSLKQPAKVTLTLKEVDPNVLAVALLGEAATVTQAATAVTAEAVVPIEGRWVPLANHAIDDGETVTLTATPSATLTEGTHYEIDYRLGMLKMSIPPVSGSTYSIAYTPLAKTYTRISGSVKPTIKMRIFLDGKNLVNGDDVRVQIDEATLTPASPIDFAAEDWSELQLTGELSTLSGKTSPYTVDIIPAD